MKKTIVFFSSCVMDSKGNPDPFMLQELPWLMSHFDRVLVCGYEGISELTDSHPTALHPIRPAMGAWRAKLSACFSKELYREVQHLFHDHQFSLRNLAKLWLFTIRAKMLAYWAESQLHPHEETTFYSYWMSYDGCAAALCKKKYPAMRAIARGHAFDIDKERNPMNPYLWKQFMVKQLDEIYTISHEAARQLQECVAVPQEKLHVLGMGSSGEENHVRLAAPYPATGILQVVSCSALVEIKQIPLLIEALSQWKGKLSWTHIGGGADEAKIRRIASEKLDALTNVSYEITGQIAHEKVTEIYSTKAFDVFLNTSRKEGVPVAIMEAMRVGLPTIAPNVGGIPDLIDSSVGFLYQPKDGAGAICEAFEKICVQTSEQREAMRVNAQNRWNEQCRSEKLLPLVFPQEEKGAAE